MEIVITRGATKVDAPKKFKTMKNAIFGLKKRHDFWTEIILFFTFQVIVYHQDLVILVTLQQ